MPFLSGFSRRKEIQYGTVFPDANLSDFPKLFVVAADSDLAAELASGGGIAVTEADGTTGVPFGLYPSSDPTSGDLILRAKFDLLTAASTGDTIGYLYYDASQTTTEDKAGVVSNGYELFAPLEEDPSGSAPQMFDWVSESNVGTTSGSMTGGDLVPGVVGNGLDFDDVAKNVTGSVTLGSDFTLECHVNLTNAGFYCGLLVLPGTGDNAGLTLNDTTRRPAVHDGASGFFASPDAMTLATWYALAGVYDSGSEVLYVNGVNKASGSGNTLSASAFRVNRDNTGGGAGALPKIDEARISSVARSADWLEYAHADDFDNADTFSLGAEEVDGGGGAVNRRRRVLLCGRR